MLWQEGMLLVVIGIILSFITTLIIREKIFNLLTSIGLVRPNYKGNNIPLSAGIAFLISTLAVAVIMLVVLPRDTRGNFLVFLLSMTGAAFLGFIDDYWGARDASGFIGHFRVLFKGKLTTGALKAIGVGFIALAVGIYLYPGNTLRIIDSIFIIALSTNMINLFDLRPGRAGKMYILLYLILLPVSLGKPEGFLAAIVLGGLAAYLAADLKARVMMGDSGSNMLGMVIGIIATAALEGPLRVLYLVLLVLLHVLTEKYSLTRIISSNTMLNYLDMLGREKAPGK